MLLRRSHTDTHFNNNLLGLDSSAREEAEEERGAATVKRFSRWSWAGILWGTDGSNWQDNFPLLEEFVRKEMGSDYSERVKMAVNNFFKAIRRMYLKARVSKDTFIKQSGPINFLNFVYEFPLRKGVRGGQVKDISMCKFRTKKARTESLRQHNSIEMLSAALEVAYIEAGYQGAGRLVSKIKGNPKAAGRYSFQSRARRRRGQLIVRIKD